MALQEFIDYLYEQVKNHSIYVFGAQGEDYHTISVNWIRKMETTERNAERAIKHWKEQCDLGYEKKLRAFDCSGLGMYKMHEMFGTPDTTSRWMYENLCVPIKRSQLKKGDWVFQAYADSGIIHHVGYIVDDNLTVIESKGRDYGVVKTKLNDNEKWNRYGRPKAFKDEIEGNDTWIATRPLKKGCKGDDVSRLQEELTDRGFGELLGKWGIDGSYGGATETAVLACQKKQLFPSKPSEWDGKAGRRTLTAMGAKCVW